MHKLRNLYILRPVMMGGAARRISIIKKHLQMQPFHSPLLALCRNMNGDVKDAGPPSLVRETDHNSMVSFLKSIFTSKDVSVLSTEVKCKSFISFYTDLHVQDRLRFLRLLSELYGVNQDNVVLVSKSVIASQEREASLLKAEERLRNSLVPQYQQLFQKIGRLEGGVKFLVDMRDEILSNLPSMTNEMEVAYLRVLQMSIRELLSLWFSLGFLSLQRITWESPCDIVQKVSDYEAVHPIRNWNDLKRRVGSYRRCFVFTHDSMPREPVVVLHTALSPEISSSIHSIIKTPVFGQVKSPEHSPTTEDDSTAMVKEDPNKIKAAIFYSITSTQRGLQGVDLGNYLIKKVVCKLQSEFPGIHQFSSLSPIPGFKDWLVTEINRQLRAEDAGESLDTSLLLPTEVEQLREIVEPESANMLHVLKGLIQTHGWVSNTQVCQVLESILMRLCARYLYKEKRRGYALNPVANFHLSNGAYLWRVNWLADMSIRGINQSCGMMVNYRYFLEDTEENSRKYLEFHEIQATENIKELGLVT